MKPTMMFELISLSERVVAPEQAGKPSKNIATDLGINRRTVENHRAAIMLKTGSKSIPALARLAFMPKVTVPSPVSFLTKLSLA